MLSFAEELMLLVLDETRGELVPSLSQRSMDVVLAGAVLMDLALRDRIDTALDSLVLVDATPVGDEVLDRTLADIASVGQERDTGYWIERTAEYGDHIRTAAITRLVARGILEEADSGMRFFLSRKVSQTRRYQTADGSPVEDVRLRIMRVLFSDDIPDPRDIVIICLADACGIFGSILSSSELAEARDRIDLVRRMDAIGRSVAAAVEALGTVPSVAPPPARVIPEDKGLPIIGHALNLGPAAGPFLLRQFRKMGPIHRLRVLGNRVVILAGPEANVFMSRDNRHLRAHDIWQDFHSTLGARHSPLGADGPQHIRMRRDHAGVYSKKLLAGDQALSTALRIVRHQVAEWPMDKPLEVLPAFQRIVLEQLGILATGLSPLEYSDDITYFFRMLIATQVSRHVPKLATMGPRYRRARRRVEELVLKILEAHAPERRVGVARDFVDDLLELNRADPHYISEADYLIFVLGPLIAGLDTAASTLAFMVYESARRPDLMERMRAEADALFENGTPTVRALGDLDVIHRVAMETLRLYPISPLLPRVAANAFEFQGHRVEASEVVLVGHTVPHLMHEYYPAPERFDIERYSPERAEHRRPGVYTPFGVGSHQCLGRSLAEALIALNLASVVCDTEFSLYPVDYRLRTARTPPYRPSKSLQIQLLRRRGTA